jgi:hypothetical protein
MSDDRHDADDQHACSFEWTRRLSVSRRLHPFLASGYAAGKN